MTDRDKIIETMARGMGNTLIPGTSNSQARIVISAELIASMAASALTAYESHLQASGRAVVPGWQRAAIGPWSEHGTYPHYVLVYNGKHVGVGFRISPNYDDDPEWCDESGEYIEPAVQLWMPIPKPPASPSFNPVVQEDPDHG